MRAQRVWWRRGRPLGVAFGRLLRTIALIALGVGCNALLAANPAPRTVLVDAETRSIDLSPSIGILFDPSRTLSIADIAARDPVEFQPLSAMRNALGFVDAVIWLHQRVLVDAGAPAEIWLTLDDSTLDLATLYVPSGNGFHTQRSGDRVPYAEHRVGYRFPVFGARLTQAGATDLYVRVESAGSIQILPRLWTSAALMTHIDSTQFLFGAYYALMVVLALSSMYAWLLLRETVFIRYAAYLGAFLMFQLAINGVAFQHLWGAYPEISTQLNGTAVGAAIIAALWFSSGFLRLAEFSPSSATLFRVLSGFVWACIALAWFGDTHLAIRFLVFGGMAVVPAFAIAAFHVLRRGYKPARYFSAAWAVLMSGVLLAGLRYAGVLPANFLTLYVLQISSTLEIVILAMALIDRFIAVHTARLQAEEAAQTAIKQLNFELNALVADRTRELETTNTRLRELARQDSMTGLFNHRAIVHTLDLALADARRHDFQVAAVMIDIDHFKRVNDRWGHPVGDAVLRAVATALSAGLREHDACGRYGGEEFLLILTHDSEAGVACVTERLRKLISALRFVEIDGGERGITASFGVALCDGKACGEQTAASLIARADEALYAAKQAGRNRIWISGQSARIDCASHPAAPP